uniref:Transcription factor SPEECHLESS n=1 Tax=Callitriche terrestris TaxID=119596 RepID=A0A8D6C0Z0_9LAMI|nr:transcription factor SPEECHLESS [Callitriche deflexa]
MLEAFESANSQDCNKKKNANAEPVFDNGEEFEFQNAAFQDFDDTDNQFEVPKLKKQKITASASITSGEAVEDGQQRISHITVERQRRKQMNDHLTVLRSLMPCFYVKRGDQASIIGGVVDYINELQQVLQSLEAKKQRKSYSEVLSPRMVSSPYPSPIPSPLSPLSPRKPPVSPRLSVPVSPRTPPPGSPYQTLLMPNIVHQQSYLNLSPLRSPIDPSPCNSSTSSINDLVNELVASSKSAIAEVEVKFSGPNLVLKTMSHRIPGQLYKIISALEQLPLEILQVNIDRVDETMLNSFTIKIGIECQLSAEELVQQIQQTFCQN